MKNKLKGFAFIAAITIAFTALSMAACGQDAVNKGYIKVGEATLWRNLTSTGNLKWSGQELVGIIDTSKPNVSQGTKWVDITITMSENGQTITISGGGSYRRQ